MNEDRGAATVLVAAVVAVAGVLVLLVGAVAAVTIARHRAGAVADLAALAAAAAEDGGCARAADIARGNDARLRRCQGSGDGSYRVDVEVRIGGSNLLTGRSVGGSARAGTASSEPDS